MEKGISVETQKIRARLSERYRKNMLRGVFDFITRLRIGIGQKCSIACTVVDDILKIAVFIYYKDEELLYEVKIKMSEIEDAQYEAVLIDRYVDFIVWKAKEMMDKKERENESKYTISNIQ